ncbi:Dna2-domain-containing protein [Fomitopsis serialis]|uniref:Dna2-domain-containing protein n=1 Tax=Fomitopsis serialis TaxID=139415 RepID=UPI002007C502|nr:Dna2-domain-containing protein [Neoantrodia serialis]KAH9923850.1 Dna2-domain-containing protein [Neoantrodia serialis]
MPPLARTKEEEDDFMAAILNEGPKLEPPATPKHRSCLKTESPCTHRALATSTPSANVFAAHDVDFAELVEGAENWDWDDMNSDILSPRRTRSPKKTPSAARIAAPAPAYVPPTRTRCVVKGVEERLSTGYLQKVLAVQVIPGEERRCVILQDDWVDTDIRPGDVINVLGDFSAPASTSKAAPVPTITINAHKNLFIHHPDLLITATALSTASQCRRKPLVTSLVRSSVDVTPSLVWGNILHEVMQACLCEGRWDGPWIETQINEVVRKCLGDLMRVNMGIEQAVNEVRLRAQGLRSFADKYMAEEPKPEAILTNTRAANGQTSLLAIGKLHDIEEDIWSPTYGLKGKVDASVQAIIVDTDDGPRDNPFTKAGPPRKNVPQTWTMPFEIKTGRAVAGMEHRAQTMLYTLLMAERYGTEVPSGLLYYTRSDEVVRVPAVRNEVRALLVTRNEMAAYMMRRMRTGGGGGGGEKDSVLEVEAFLPPTIDDAWQCGKCFALDTCMLYRKTVENVVDTASPIADIYALKTGHITPEQGAFFKKWEALVSLEEQDLVRFKKELWTMGAQERERHGRCFSNMVLDRTYHWRPEAQTDSRIHGYTYRFFKESLTQTSSFTQSSLLNGHMSCGDAITVSVEPDLLAFAKGFIVDLTPQEVIVGVDHEIDMEAVRARIRANLFENVIFRIDKDELFSGLGRIRDNLAQLYHPDGDTKRLELIVDLKRPEFDEIEQLTLDKTARSAMNKLNTSQQIAAAKVLTAQDYALILGMPGTGKTTVIAAIIQMLVSLGKTVLLASYTHSAVDTILLKLKHVADFGILRIGNLDKMHPDVHEFTLANRRVATTMEQLEHQVMSPPVVATTCLSIDQTGLEVSLFRMLSDTHPHAVVDLNEQYRMNADIMLLSNKLIYSDRLRCGSETVAQQSLKIPDPTFSVAGGICWLGQLLDERCKAVFVDTDAVPAYDSPVGDLVENRVEARLVYQVTECLIRSGIRQDQIGVLSLYRQQIKLLSHLLHHRQEVEILTADRSQGRDKECIIIPWRVGDLMKDWRRMNVAFTRARAKLIIVGSRTTLQGTPLLKEFLQLMDEKDWILPLPPNAHEMHTLPALTDSNMKKRSADDLAEPLSPDRKENTPTRPNKKGRKSAIADEAILKGRSLLKDLMNESS